MKICAECKNELPIDAFSIRNRERDGHYCYCKECKSKQDKLYRKNNKDKIKKKAHEKYLRNIEHINKKSTLYSKQNREKCRAWGTKAKNKLKAEIFVHYGNGEIKCKLCPELDLNLLTIDHINGNGNQHRKEIGKKTGYNFYSWLKKNNYPDGYQVLCWTCQFKKRILEMRPTNPTPRQIKNAEYVQSVKTECLQHYGEVCDCGEDDQVVLTLDHVNDDGGKQRKETGKWGFGFYLFLRKNGFPNNPPLVVKCIKCQYRKRIKNEEERKLNKSDGGNGSAGIISGI